MKSVQEHNKATSEDNELRRDNLRRYVAVAIRVHRRSKAAIGGCDLDDSFLYPYDSCAKVEVSSK